MTTLSENASAISAPTRSVESKSRQLAYRSIGEGRAGHGPHHEFPEAVAGYITTFIRTTN